MYGIAWFSVSFATFRQGPNSPTMSSKRKKAESIASSIIILVDLDRAMVRDADGKIWRLPSAPRTSGFNELSTPSVGFQWVRYAVILSGV